MGRLEAMPSAPSAMPWPPSDEDLAWRPEIYPLRGSIDVEGQELPAATLAEVRLGSTLGDVITVSAVAKPDVGYRIVVRDEYDTKFTPPIEHTTEPLALGEMLQILDETTRCDEPGWKGVTDAYRSYNAETGN